MIKRLFFLLMLCWPASFLLTAPAAATLPHPPTVETATKAHINIAKPAHKKKGGLFVKWKQKLLTKAVQKGWLGEGKVTEKQKRWGRLSMILGLAGLVLLFIPTVSFVAIPAAIVALVFGIKSVDGNSNANGIIGIIAGGLTLLLLILAIAVLVAFFASWN